MEPLNTSLIFRRFRKLLEAEFGAEDSRRIWRESNERLRALKCSHPDITGDSKLLILPAATLYLTLREYAPDRALPLLRTYGTGVGEQIAGVIHSVTSVPGVSRRIWSMAPRLMRASSSPDKGYTRRIVSETQELVAVDILSCPIHDAAVRIGVPEAALLVCAMDKAYMSGFRHICYTRTESVAEGGQCCDYRLSFDYEKMEKNNTSPAPNRYSCPVGCIYSLILCKIDKYQGTSFYIRKGSLG